MASTIKSALKKPAVKTAPAEAVGAEPAKAAGAAPETSEDSDVKFVRRKEMVERIVGASGLKPNLVKSVLDAVLLEMGNALSAGEGLNLQPLGKLVVNRRKDIEGGEVLNCKLRRKVLPVGQSMNPAETSQAQAHTGN